MFLNKVFYAHQGSKSDIAKLFSYLIYFKMQFNPVMAKLNLTSHYTSLMSHDPSEIILICC